MPTPKKKIITVTLEDPQPKKHSVRYDSPREDDWLSSVYLRNEAAEQLGHPDKIKVTVEAA